jgi:3-phenylpropionate/trans-cinnamate dioxygenase ferredoxin component
MAERALLQVNAVTPGTLQAFEVVGHRVAVANVNGTFYAFDDACTHMGCSLVAQGRLSGATVTCDCHGSQFDVRTGTVLHGPATRPVQTYPVDADGHVHVG